MPELKQILAWMPGLDVYFFTQGEPLYFGGAREINSFPPDVTPRLSILKYQPDIYYVDYVKPAILLLC